MLLWRVTTVYGVIRKTDIVFRPFWLGAAKAGCKTALINTTLSDSSLLHSLQISRCRFIITHKIYEENVSKVLPDLPADVKLLVYGGEPLSGVSIDSELEFANRINPDPKNYQNLSLADQVLMIYTSGTTGKLKTSYQKLI